MRNWNNILKVLLLVAVYCFGIYVPTNTLPSSNTQTIEQSNNKKERLTTSTKVLYAHTQQFENLFSDLANYSFPNFKLPYFSFWAVICSNDLLFNAKFKQYKDLLKTILIRHRKSDLIFPFHNFW